MVVVPLPTVPWVSEDLQDDRGVLEADVEATQLEAFIAETKRFRELVTEALGPGASHDRAAAAVCLDDMARQAWISERGAEFKRRANRERAKVGGVATGAATAAAGAASGGALAAQASGTVASVIGIATLVLVVAAAAMRALGADYERNRRKRRLYRQLRSDIWSFALVSLPTAQPETTNAQLNAFSARYEQIG